MGSPGAWVLHGNLVRGFFGGKVASWVPRLTKVSRVGEQFCAECTLTGHCPCQPEAERAGRQARPTAPMEGTMQLLSREGHAVSHNSKAALPRPSWP